MHTLHDSGASLGSDTEDDDLAILWVNGSVALDTQARTAIKAALRDAGIRCVSERLLSTSSPALAGVGVGKSSIQSSSPRLALLVGIVAGLEKGLEETLARALNPAFGNCFSISFDHSEIESLFPPTSARHTAITEPADSQLPPDHERRVFTFDNDDVDLNGKHNESEQEYEEEDEDDDIVAEQLVVIPRSSLPESRPESSQKNLARTTPASDSSRKALDASEEPDSTLRLASQSPQRPTSAFKARKVPASSSAPTIQPRLSKAAALRMGIELSERKIAKAEVDENGTPVEKEEVVVPGTIRRTVTPPKSLSKPTVAPRQNRASALRTADGRDKGGPLVRPSTKRRESLGTSQRSAGFEGLPGFAKRPVQPPNPPKDEVTAGPGQNRASLLRQQSQEGNLAPIPKPTSRRQSLTTAERAAAFARSRPSLDQRSSSRNGSFRFGTASSEASMSRAALSREHSMNDDEQISTVTGSLATTSLSPARPPSIVPRPNKAAELRLAAQKAGRM